MSLQQELCRKGSSLEAITLVECKICQCIEECAVTEIKMESNCLFCIRASEN